MNTGKILIVDDESHTRELVSDILSEEGHEIEAVSSAKEALLTLTQKYFHILLSDIQMPEMDGVALMKETRKKYPDLEVILMTAYAGLPSALEAIRHGAYDYLPKPLSRENLLNTVRRCLEKIDLRKKLKESQAKLVDQEKLAAVGAVSAWLSHKMRNSLSVILMCAHYLQQKLGETPQGDLKEVLTAILDKVKLLEHITSDLINYSRRYDLHKSSEKVHFILEDVLKSLQVQIQFEKMNVLKQFDPALPEVWCDQHVLQEAFENIILNSLQAVHGQENQSLTLKTQLVKEYQRSARDEAAPSANGAMPAGAGPNPMAVVTIANTGSFIPPEILGKIFTPFFTTKESGSGLGLAIVKKIVEEHGGEIFVESRDENGMKTTAIRMALPLGNKA